MLLLLLLSLLLQRGTAAMNCQKGQIELFGRLLFLVVVVVVVVVVLTPQRHHHNGK
jgi:uncharacterized protein (UPF0333 family)